MSFFLRFLLTAFLRRAEKKKSLFASVGGDGTSLAVRMYAALLRAACSPTFCCDWFVRYLKLSFVLAAAAAKLHHPALAGLDAQKRGEGSCRDCVSMHQVGLGGPVENTEYKK